MPFFRRALSGVSFSSCIFESPFFRQQKVKRSHISTSNSMHVITLIPKTKSCNFYFCIKICISHPPLSRLTHPQTKLPTKVSQKIDPLKNASIITTCFYFTTTATTYSIRFRFFQHFVIKLLIKDFNHGGVLSEKKILNCFNGHKDSILKYSKDLWMHNHLLVVLHAFCSRVVAVADLKLK